MDADTMLLWSIDETAGYDSAWARVSGSVLRAEGRAVALRARPYWIDYQLETRDDFVHRALRVTSRWQGGSASLELVRSDNGEWTVDGDPRPDLADALDCDLAACPLTNAMPILRHRLHQQTGDETFVMAFVEVPELRVVTSEQRYFHMRRTDDDGAVVGFRAGSFEADLTVDRDGFVVDYPQLGRRVTEGAFPPGIRAAGPGSSRPG